MWVSLTCSPEHTARQCRNFTFPAAAVKWHNCRSYYLLPLIIACITLNMYVERCLPAWITLSIHIVVHIVAHIVVHSLMHIKVQEISWGGCPATPTPPLNLGGRCPPRPPMAYAALVNQSRFIQSISIYPINFNTYAKLTIHAVMHIQIWLYIL